MILTGLAVASLLQIAAPIGIVRGRVLIGQGDPQETVVYLVPEADGAGGVTGPPDSIMIDQRELRFLPKVLAVRPWTVVRFRNSDPVLHNVFSPPGPGTGFDLGTYPRPESRSATLAEPGLHIVLCHVHPEMVAYLLVVPTRLFASVDADGEFVFPAVPAGRYQLVAWRPRSNAMDRMIEVGPGMDVRQVLELAPRRGED